MLRQKARRIYCRNRYFSVSFENIFISSAIEELLIVYFPAKSQISALWIGHVLDWPSATNSL